MMITHIGLHGPSRGVTSDHHTTSPEVQFSHTYHNDDENVMLSLC
ncbi:hypothetical protein Hdeb2414_s0023g00624331 [Helianthus debilis subsp. tardiflorus]